MNAPRRIHLLPFLLAALLPIAGTSRGADDAPPSGIIRGKVLNAVTGDPVEDFALECDPPEGTTTVDTLGGFAIALLPADVYVVTVRAQGYGEGTAAVTVAAGATVERDITLTPIHRVSEEITVSSSVSLNRSDAAPGVALDRQHLVEQPHIGDDVIRALPLLPGVAAGDTSGQFSVRGGLYREVLFQLDGLEIYEPYHLKDYDSVITILDPRLLDEVRLFPGGFPVEYGDRSAGVLDLHTIKPSNKAAEAGLNFTTMWANAQGGFADDRGTYYGSVRRGFLDLIMKIAGPGNSDTQRTVGNEPAYWDANAMLGYQLAPGSQLTGRVLWSQDKLNQEQWEIEDSYPERELFDTRYGNSSAWLRHDWVLGGRAFASTIASFNRVDRNRHAEGEDYVGATTIRDARQLDVYGLRQDWTFEASPSHLFKLGADMRRYDAGYDYENQFSHWGQDDGRAFLGDLRSTTVGAYAADRVRLGRLTAEMGARWDRQSATGESQVSPRVNLAWAGTGSTMVRAGWGYFSQSQRPHELQVEDGETMLAPAERAEHRTLGIEQSWQRGKVLWSLRGEAYQRLVRDVRPRYENMFNPFAQFPETEYDRYRIAPASAEARGIELFLARRGGGHFDWWANYTWGEATDRIDGRDVPRQLDQTHAATVSATWRPSPAWTVTGAWLYHTGWPTTAVSGLLQTYSSGEQDVKVLLGPINGERLPDYHRLDVRLARRFRPKRAGELEISVDIQNAYNRKNVSGYIVDDRAFSVSEAGEVVYTPRERNWLGIVPSLGITWRF